MNLSTTNQWTCPVQINELENVDLTEKVSKTKNVHFYEGGRSGKFFEHLF